MVFKLTLLCIELRYPVEASYISLFLETRRPTASGLLLFTDINCDDMCLVERHPENKLIDSIIV